GSVVGLARLGGGEGGGLALGADRRQLGLEVGLVEAAAAGGPAGGGVDARVRLEQAGGEGVALVGIGGAAAVADGDEGVAALPFDSTPTRGVTPCTVRAKIAPITANCTRLIGLQSTFAPMSMSTHGRPEGRGKLETIAGRSIPSR